MLDTKLRRIYKYSLYLDIVFISEIHEWLEDLFSSQVDLGYEQKFIRKHITCVSVCPFEVILHSNKIVYNPFLITRVYDEILLNCMQS